MKPLYLIFNDDIYETFFATPPPTVRWRDSATFLRIKKLDVPLLYYHCWLVSSFAIKDVCSHINAMLPRESQFNFAGDPSLHLFPTHQNLEP